MIPSKAPGINAVSFESGSAKTCIRGKTTLALAILHLLG
jgi:hypothetical protein